MLSFRIKKEFLLIFYILLFLSGCYIIAVPTSISSPSANTRYPSTTPSENRITETPHSLTTITTPSINPSLPTGGLPPAKLDLCNSKNLNNCIFAFQLGSINGSLLIYLNLDQKVNQKFNSMVNGKEYKVEPIAGITGKYVIEIYPISKVNQYLFIQIFSSISSNILQEGNVFLDYSQIIPTATSTNLPPRNPYIP